MYHGHTRFRCALPHGILSFFVTDPAARAATPAVPTLARPSRAIAFGATALLVLSARFAWGTPAQAEWFQANLGYYMVFLLGAFAAYFFVRAARARGWFTRATWREHTSALLLIAAGSVFLHAFEPHLLRVYFDEPTHALVAMGMHLDKSAMGATVSNYVGDAFVTGDPYAVTRPYFFPLLVSVLHDLTGYRVQNVFVLNALLTPLVLLGAYLVAFAAGGRLAGWVAAALLVSFPLLAQNVTSGGYDALNMALVAALILATLAYWRSDGAARAATMDLCVAVALLLACTRAESILYLVPLGAVTLARWWREQRVELTWFAALSPLFLAPAFMTNLHMVRNDVAMQADLRAGGQGYFGLTNLPPHLADAVRYFFRFDLDATNSVILSTIGCVGFVWLVARAMGIGRARRIAVGGATGDAVSAAGGTAQDGAPQVIVALFALSVFAVYLVMLAQFWSSPLDPLAARFCLSLSLMLAVAGGWAVARIPWLVAHPRVVGAALGVWTAMAAEPAMARATATHAMLPARADRYFMEYASARDHRTTMYAMQGNASFIANGFASTLIHRVRMLPAPHVRALKAGLYRDIFVLQTLQRADGDQWLAPEAQRFPPTVVLETVTEREIAPSVLARVSRLVGYRKPDGTLVTAASDDPAVNIRTAFANDDDARRYRLSLYP